MKFDCNLTVFNINACTCTQGYSILDPEGVRNENQK